MKILAFYTSTAQRDAERVGSQWALLNPTHKFLPFQIQRDHLAGTYVDSVTLTDCDDNDTDVTDYFFGAEMVLTGWTSAGLNAFVQTIALPTILTEIGRAHV